MSLWDRLPHTFSATRKSVKPDDFGGETQTPRAIATNVACWLQPASAAEIIEFQRRDMIVTHKLYVTTEQNLRSGDVLTMGAGPYSGDVYDFRSQVECTAGTEVGWKIMVENKR